MAIDTKERTFEQEIEYWLTQGANKAELYVKGSPSDFSREYAMDTKAVIAFVKDTQPDEWKALIKRHGSEKAAEAEFLKRLNAELNQRDMIDVLRHGIVDLGIPVRLAYFKPGSGMNKSATALYEKNVLQITRQVKYSLQSENSID
ncbi:MAG: type I restriction endonuclease subunit R, partial [Desulfosporosinus sp.]